MIWDEDDPRFNALMRLAQSQEGMPANSGAPSYDPYQRNMYQKYLDEGAAEREVYGTKPLGIDEYFKQLNANKGPTVEIKPEQTSGLDKLLSSVGNAVMTGKTTGGPGFSDTLNKRGKYLKNFGK